MGHVRLPKRSQVIIELIRKAPEVITSLATFLAALTGLVALLLK